MTDMDSFGFPMVDPSARSLRMRERALPGNQDAPFMVTIGKGASRICHPAWRVWSHMIERCYSPRELARFPSYAACEVCPEWLSFMAFYSWMAGVDWLGKHLDKDVIQPGNKVYHPDFCAFVDHYVNLCILSGPTGGKGLPAGVTLEKKTGKFIARCQDGSLRVYLGLHSTVEDARLAVLTFKKSHILSVADQQSDARVAAGLRLHAEALS